MTIAEETIALLRKAGPTGLSAASIAQRLSITRGRLVMPEAVSTTISNHRAARHDSPFRYIWHGHVRVWVLAADAKARDAPARGPAPPDTSLQPHSLTAALLGDPLPGRSAYDQRLLGKSHA